VDEWGLKGGENGGAKEMDRVGLWSPTRHGEGQDSDLVRGSWTLHLIDL